MKIAIIFGGVSTEHDISIITGIQVVNAAIKQFDVLPIYVHSNGLWYYSPKYTEVGAVSSARGKRVTLHCGDRGLYTVRGRRICNIDCAVIAMHGRNGEDGTVSGILQMSAIPYVGSGILASSVGMDKEMFKRVISSAGVATAPYFAVRKCDYRAGVFELVDEVKKMGFPVIVKPAHLGSSIGIGTADEFDTLFSVIDSAFAYDDKVIIERKLPNVTEVNCAVMGHGNRLMTGELEEPVPLNEFLNFRDKYESGSKGMASGRYIPARIPSEIAERVVLLARKVYALIDAGGIARIDFLISDGEVYVNEINTVPGSLAYYLFDRKGVHFDALVKDLIDDAMQRDKENRALVTYFPSGVLNANGAKKLTAR